MPFCAPGLLSTLCTAFYALIGMLLRGGKTVEKCEFFFFFFFFARFLVSTFIYCYFVRFRMFITFTYLFFFVDVDLRSVCVWTLPWIRFALDATVHDFYECFEKSLYGRNLLLTIQNFCFSSFHGTSDSPPMKG